MEVYTKKSTEVFVAGLLLTGIISLVSNGCGQTGGGATTGGGYFKPKAAETTPVFKPATASSQSVSLFKVTAQSTSEWGAGNPLYTVYFSLREFVSARDEGKVDRSNVYKLLTDVDTVFASATVEVQTITEQEITPPFSRLQKQTCDKLHNDTANKRALALKETDTLVNAVMSWIWTDSPTKNEYGVASATFNKSTNDLTVDMSYSVDYDITSTETDYNLHGYISGNAAQNTFQYKYIIGDCQIVGQGVSRGAGNYMLIKYSGFSGGTKYIVVPGDADESFFIAQNSSPTQIFSSPADLPASVEAYKDWVANTAFFTSADLLTDTASLNSGTTRAGTIYLNYD